MSTATKLTYLNETKTLLKNKINLTGANITTDTFRQYPTKLQNALLNIWNNEGEPIFTNWGTKVNGEGTNVKLDNTLNARMKITPKGNTTQNGTPTPSSPINVNVVSGDNEVKVINKNLLEVSLPNATKNGITFTNNGDGTITLQGTATANADFRIDQLTPGGLERPKNYNGTYTLSCNELIPNVELCTLAYNNGSYTPFMGSITSSSPIKTQTINITNGFIYVLVRNGVSIPNGITLKPMLLNGSYTIQTLPNFVPYTSQNYPLYLGDIELCKIGTYQDYIYKDSGSWYLHKEIGKYTFTGNEVWSYNSVTQGSLFRSINTITNHLKDATYSPYSDYYKGIPANNVTNRQNNQFYIQTNFNYLDIIDNRYTNSDDFKNWLSSNNVSIYYILATPTEEEITNSTLINQLEQLKGAMSYEGQTNISSGFMIIGASALGELE